MSYLRPDFDQDVFISYAHYDDEPVLGEKEGWVAQLYNELRKRVLVHLGQEPALWLDCDIRNNDDFEVKIANRLARTGTLLTVVSESFLKRPWCQRELEDFCRNAESKLGLRVGEKIRIFRVSKTEVDKKDLPEQFGSSLSYVFCGEDPDDPNPKKRIHEYRPSLGGQQPRLYFLALDELAKDIADTLRIMRDLVQGGAAGAAATQTGIPSATVYLAETTEDQESARSSIKKELQDRNITVLPQGDLPYRGSQFEPLVRECLQKSDLSIHIFGKDAGFIPEGRQRPQTWLQHDLAMQRSNDPNFRRVLWLPSMLESADEAQRRYLHDLQNDVTVQRGAEILRDRLEELKTEMLHMLEQIERKKEERLRPPAPVSAPAPSPTPSVTIASGEPLKIYLICDSQDLQDPVFLALRDFLFAQGFEPRVALLGENAKEARKNHEMLLQYSDAYLIYYGAASGQWVQTKLNDFLRLSSKRKSPVLGKCTYLAPPVSEEKRSFRSNDAKPIGGGADFDPKSLTEFLQSLRRPAGH